MKEINGTQYKLMLMDTGVVSKVLKNPRDERNALVKIITSVPAFPCFSIFTIYELRKRIDLYNLFLDISSVVPFILLKTPNMLFDDEIRNYPKPNLVDPIVFSFSFVNKDPLAHVKTFMSNLFSNPDVLANEISWNSGWKGEGLASVLKLKDNFRPSGERYNANDASRFIKEGLIQYVYAQKAEWVHASLNSVGDFSEDGFPSVKMLFYSVFYRFYAENREPEEQDVFDLFISCLSPYVDIVVTENFQAEILRKVKSRDTFLSHLQIETHKFFQSA